MPTSPTAPTAVPDFPAIGDASYNTKAYNWATHMDATYPAEMQALATNAYNNAVEADADATTATTKAAEAVAAASAATATANASAWVNGGTYALNANAISGVDFQTYRKKTASSVTTTDPSADSTNWVKLGSGSSLLRSARTSNTALAAADNSKLIDITSGTFSQTFSAVATLGDGWYCYIRNSGTGDITLDPNASETIDGLTSFVMYPGECRLVQCDGAALQSVVVSGFQKTFTSTGTFTKPPGYKVFSGLMWGGGASGERTNNIVLASRGGSASGVFPFDLSAAAFAATETITVGAGGAAVTGVAAGNSGGTSSIGSLLTQAGASNTAGSATGGAAPWAGGNSAASGVGGSSVYGGGGGGSTNDLNPGTAYAGGTSTVAGAGGAGGTTTNGVDGSIPGGGGGATKTGTTSGAGARGEVRIWGAI